MISIRKRGKVYQYCFEAGKVNGKRKQITKSGFKTKNCAHFKLFHNLLIQYYLI